MHLSLPSLSCSRKKGWPIGRGYHHLVGTSFPARQQNTLLIVVDDDDEEEDADVSVSMEALEQDPALGYFRGHLSPVVWRPHDISYTPLDKR